MTEAEIIEQLVEFQNVLLFGVSIYLTVVSLYVFALYAFLDEAGWLLKFFAFAFISMTFIFLGAFFYGSARFQMGLVDALAAMESSLSAAGRAALANARSGIDDWIRNALLAAAGGFYLALALLTFWNGWRKASHLRVSEVHQQ